MKYKNSILDYTNIFLSNKYFVFVLRFKLSEIIKFRQTRLFGKYICLCCNCNWNDCNKTYVTRTNRRGNVRSECSQKNGHVIIPSRTCKITSHTINQCFPNYIRLRLTGGTFLQNDTPTGRVKDRATDSRIDCKREGGRWACCVEREAKERIS